MEVINNNRKINVKVGDVIKYGNKTSPYPAYAMIIESHENSYKSMVRGHANLFAW